MTAPTLQTPRLTIAPLRLDQFEEQYAFMADPRVTSFIGSGAPRPRQESWQKYCMGAGLWSIMGYGYWGISERASGRLIGMGGLGRFERGMAQLEGYPEAGWAFAADTWGQGIATEFLRAVLGWADGHLNAPEIRCIIDPQNAPSIRVAEKNGFARIDEAKDEHGSLFVFARRLPGRGVE